MISAILCVTIAVFFAASILMMILMVADAYPDGAAVNASMWTMVGAATLLGGLLMNDAGAGRKRYLIPRHHSAKMARQNHQLADFRYLNDISIAGNAPTKLWQAAKKARLFNEIKGNGGEDGIRTHDTLLTYTPLAGERLRPLGHLSGAA